MIRPTIVTSIENLISGIKKDYADWQTSSFPWFRGEPATAIQPQKIEPLLPNLYRHNPGKKTHNENNLLQQFRMKAPSLGLMNTPPRDHTDEWLFLAQHVGLPTRLIDWSEGLMVALYFALKEASPVIWMLDPVELNRKSSKEVIKDNEFPLTWFSPDKTPMTRSDFVNLISNLSPKLKEAEGKSRDQDYESGFSFTSNIGNLNIRGAWENNEKIGTDFPVAIHPTNIHSRMHAQKSCFTIHGKIKQSLAELVDNRILRKYLIPPEYVNSLQKDLRLIGFTRTSIYPDLDNLAKDLSDIF
jgi:hypothetical protein